MKQQPVFVISNFECNYTTKKPKEKGKLTICSISKKEAEEKCAEELEKKFGKNNYQYKLSCKNA